jgi:hypothetical protein
MINFLRTTMKLLRKLCRCYYGIGEQENPFRKYGLSCAPQGGKSQTLQQTERLIKKDGLGEYLKVFCSTNAYYSANAALDNEETKEKKNKGRFLVSLYRRGFFVDVPEEVRKELVKKI